MLCSFWSSWILINWTPKISLGPPNSERKGPKDPHFWNPGYNTELHMGETAPSIGLIQLTNNRGNYFSRCFICALKLRNFIPISASILCNHITEFQWAIIKDFDSWGGLKRVAIFCPREVWLRISTSTKFKSFLPVKVKGLRLYGICIKPN